MNKRKKNEFIAPCRKKFSLVCESVPAMKVRSCSFSFRSAAGRRRQLASCRKVTTVEQMLTNTENHDRV